MPGLATGLEEADWELSSAVPLAVRSAPANQIQKTLNQKQTTKQLPKTLEVVSAELKTHPEQAQGCVQGFVIWV